MGVVLLKTVCVTCGCEDLSVGDGGPAAVVLLSWGGLVRRVSEEAGGCEQAVTVFDGAAEPAVVLLGLLDRPADVDALGAVPVHLTLQLLGLRPIHVAPQRLSCDINDGQRLCSAPRRLPLGQSAVPALLPVVPSEPDWSRAGRPVLEAVTQICGQDVTCLWKKKVVCVVWLKLLSREAEEDVETSWRENPFFPLHNGLPELNHVVLLELVKATAAADVFASFLLRLPQSQICVELERLIRFVRSSPVREEDVQLFLDVWWELWKGRRDQTTGGGGEETIEVMFANQFARLSSQSSGVTPQAAKRLKLDTSDQPTADVLHLLLQALKDMKDHTTSADLCLRAVSTSLDSLYTTSLIDKQVSLPAKEKMLMLSKAVSLREKNHNRLSPELVQEAQRDLRASHTPSQFQPSRVKLPEALKLVTDLTQVWLSSGLLTSHASTDVSYSGFRLQQSLQRVLTALEEPDQEPEVVTERNKLRALMESLQFPDVETTPEVDVKVAAIIISHRLDGCRDFAALFAGERSWASSDQSWLDCVEQNQAVFQQHDTLLHLASTLMSQLHSRSSDVSRCRKLMKVIADIFSALSLEDKNKSLAAMLKLSPGVSVGALFPRP
ncbi:hypothetical protein INR49_003191 [Caranx melampygus]|nr:hypothetical protein INR49_003191 [Caranx melampygus]